jgi:hypothetical protein
VRRGVCTYVVAVIGSCHKCARVPFFASIIGPLYPDGITRPSATNADDEYWILRHRSTDISLRYLLAVHFEDHLLNKVRGYRPASARVDTSARFHGVVNQAQHFCYAASVPGSDASASGHLFVSRDATLFQPP